MVYGTIHSGDVTHTIIAIIDIIAIPKTSEKLK
jgi:hypothetical protein